MQQTFVITGTDTGVGKTVLTCLLVAFLTGRGQRVIALKPVCSGGRDDARRLRRALGNAVPLHSINPWYFRAPVAPLLAARAERRSLRLTQVTAHIRNMALVDPETKFLLVEGAGGLLSPLGEGFSTRELIVALKATPIIVAPNTLGVINHIRLTLESLPRSLAARARIVLMNPARPDRASRTNAALVRELAGLVVVTLPYFSKAGTTTPILSTRIVPALLGLILGQNGSMQTARARGDSPSSQRSGTVAIRSRVNIRKARNEMVVLASNLTGSGD